MDSCWRADIGDVGCLSARCQLGDIADVDAVVGCALSRTGLRLSAAEREELEAEGMQLLCQWARAFESGALTGSLAGYAVTFLPGRLRRIYLGWHYVRRRGPDGARSWERRRVCSYEVEVLGAAA